MAYQQLHTEKYWQESVNQEIKLLRVQKNREARQALRNFLAAIAVTILVGYALQTMPTWLPSVVSSLEYYGVIPTQFPEDVIVS